jgi:hypothetical protein
MSKRPDMEATQLYSASAVLDTWSSHDWSKGVQLENIPDLTRLEVHTQNSIYEITVISGRTGDILVRGGQFFTELTEARLAGSSLGGSFLKLRGIYIGFKVEIHSGERIVLTSRVRSAQFLTSK